MHLLSWFSFKAIVHSKHRRKLLKMYLTSGHPRYRRVCFFNAILWIEISYFNHNQRFKLKPSYWRICYKHSFSLHKMLTDGLEWCRLLVMFLSAVWTLILTAPIHCRASNGEQVMQCYISPNLMMKQTHLGWPGGECIFSEFHFWVNFCFNPVVCCDFGS